MNLVQFSSNLKVPVPPTVRTLCKDTPHANPSPQACACPHLSTAAHHTRAITSELGSDIPKVFHHDFGDHINIHQRTLWTELLSICTIASVRLITVRLIVRVWAGWRLMPSLVRVGHLKQFQPTWHSLTLHFSRRGPDDQSCIQERFKEGDNQAQETATKA